MRGAAGPRTCDSGRANRALPGARTDRRAAMRPRDTLSAGCRRRAVARCRREATRQAGRRMRLADSAGRHALSAAGPEVAQLPGSRSRRALVQARRAGDARPSRCEAMRPPASAVDVLSRHHPNACGCRLRGLCIARRADRVHRGTAVCAGPRRGRKTCAEGGRARGRAVGRHQARAVCAADDDPSKWRSINVRPIC
jgi:hypothetical protein